MSAADQPNGWHHNVLSVDQRKALELTSSLLAHHPGMFLAGGTALALSFGHRRSRDLEWFSAVPFDHLQVATELRSQPGTRIVHAEPGTIHAECQGIAFSLIRYGYPVDATDQHDGTPFASLGRMLE